MRVLHLVGSPTSDFHADLSRLYATDCLEAIGGEDLESHVAYVTPDGRWRFPEELGREAIDAAAPLSAGDAVGRITALAVDVVVPQMFCVAGMTSYRALFDVLGVPYVGNAPDVMALTADKAKARAVVAAAGVDVPRGQVVRREDVVRAGEDGDGHAPGNDPDRAVRADDGDDVPAAATDRPTIAPPAVVKPVDADNSVGVTLVRDAADYDAALAAALEHADAALVEEYVPLGREVRCGVLEEDGRLRCLPLEEYRVGDVRTAEDKIVRHADGDLRLMAKDAERAWIVAEDDPITPAVHELARRAYVALGCRHYGLFDVRVDPDGRPWFLEASLYCSFAEQSVLCVMARAVGTGPAELFRRTARQARTGRNVAAARPGPTPTTKETTCGR